MSVVTPAIDSLLENTDGDKFLLCAVASRRARDINDMMRGQRDRALARHTAAEILEFTGRKPLSVAMDEVARGEVGYDVEAFEKFGA